MVPTPLVTYHATMARPQSHSISMIVSGGQTGVDQAALSAAIWLGMAHGGWCPKGRRSEAGPIPAEFELRESHSRVYSVRTKQNIEDSDGTLILYHTEMTGGTAFTCRMADQRAKPVLTINLDGPVDFDEVDAWISGQGIRVLNVAGPRESSYPGIGDETRELLVRLLGAREASNGGDFSD